MWSWQQQHFGHAEKIRHERANSLYFDVQIKWGTQWEELLIISSNLSYEVLLLDVLADVANWICGFLQHGQPGLVLVLFPREGACLLAAIMAQNPPPPRGSTGLQLWGVHLHVWKVKSEKQFCFINILGCCNVYEQILMEPGLGDFVGWNKSHFPIVSMTILDLHAQRLLSVLMERCFRVFFSA